MSPELREVARQFGIGNATLEDLREAASDERINRRAADEMLKLIAEWEHRGGSRNELRTRVRDLIPPPPRHPDGGTFYDAGIKAQQRRPR